MVFGSSYVLSVGHAGCRRLWLTLVVRRIDRLAYPQVAVTPPGFRFGFPWYSPGGVTEWSCPLRESFFPESNGRILCSLALRRYCYARSLHTRDNVFTASAIGQHKHGQLSYYSNYCASCDAGKNASVTRRHFLTICRLSCASINSESIP
jgi:hypothetical protein